MGYNKASHVQEGTKGVPPTSEKQPDYEPPSDAASGAQGNDSDYEPEAKADSEPEATPYYEPETKPRERREQEAKPRERREQEAKPRERREQEAKPKERREPEANPSGAESTEQGRNRCPRLIACFSDHEYGL